MKNKVKARSSRILCNRHTGFGLYFGAMETIKYFYVKKSLMQTNMEKQYTKTDEMQQECSKRKFYSYKCIHQE